METKKNKRVDLENFKSIFFIVGLIISMGIVLYAFEWESEAKSDEIFGKLQINSPEEELTPLVNEVKEKPAPPPLLVTEFVTVDDKEPNLPEPLIFDPEITKNTPIYSIPVFNDTLEDSIKVFVNVEEMPEFPGGTKALLRFIAQSVKYPVVAKENYIQGKVFVQFIINSKGEVTGTKVIRGVDPSLDQEALRVVNKMPLWRPGKQSGKAVDVSYTVPINFVLM